MATEALKSPRYAMTVTAPATANIARFAKKAASIPPCQIVGGGTAVNCHSDRPCVKKLSAEKTLPPAQHTLK